MRDVNILRYVSQHLWAMTEDKWAEILPVLMRHVRGDRLSAEEIAEVLSGHAKPPMEAQTLEAGAFSTAQPNGNAVAVIPICGVIAHRMDSMEEMSGGASTESIGKMIDRAAADPGVGTLLYIHDTPGGSVPGVPELADKMFALRGVKKQITQIHSLSASAGYWLASQSDEIVCMPSGWAGNIGVYSVHQDLSEALTKLGVKTTIISQGKFKVEGNPFEPLSDEGMKFRQERVNDTYALFTKAVARGRGVTPSEVRTGYGEGRALPAKMAKEAGLIDRIATLDETIQRLTSRPSGATQRAEAATEPDLVGAGGTDLRRRRLGLL